MNSRDRFINIMRFTPVDRAPLFEDGIRTEVLRAWRGQGLGRNKSLDSLISLDKREEIEPNLDPSPTPSHWPRSMLGLNRLAQCLDPEDPKRLPENWNQLRTEWKDRDYPLILRVHRGYFLSMGVHGWHRFSEAVQLLVDKPHFVEKWMEIFAEFSSRLADQILQQIDVDGVLFSEPIGGNHGPLISPGMYESFVIKSYLPILRVVKEHGVQTIIYRTYANTRLLLPAVVRAGFNCLWACETNPQAMDYAEIRHEFGKDLRLIGGIDADSLRSGQQEIYRSMLESVPPLLDSGGYIPLADGRVREDVPFENYIYYRKLLESLSQEK